MRMMLFVTGGGIPSESLILLTKGAAQIDPKKALAVQLDFVYLSVISRCEGHACDSGQFPPRVIDALH